jgi:hypothetical protein
MAILASSSLPQLTDIINRSRLLRLKTYEHVMFNSGLVRKDPKPLGTGLFTRYREALDMSLYTKTRDEGSVSAAAKVQYGYEKDLAIKQETLELSVTKLMRDGGKDNEIRDIVSQLSEVVPNSIELDLTHRLTFAFASSYADRSGKTIDTTVGDGNPLGYTAHALTGSATTYNNIVVGNPQFSKGALESALKQSVEETYSNLGEKVAMNFDVVYCSLDPNTNNQIDELFKATADVTSNNAATFNVYQNRMRKVSIPLLATTAAGATDTTKAKYWGIASTQNTSFYYSELQSPYMKSPMDGNNGEEFSSENWNYLVGVSYGITIPGARWLHASK